MLIWNPSLTSNRGHHKVFHPYAMPPVLSFRKRLCCFIVVVAVECGFCTLIFATQQMLRLRFLAFSFSWCHWNGRCGLDRPTANCTDCCSFLPHNNSSHVVAFYFIFFLSLVWLYTFLYYKFTSSCFLFLDCCFVLINFLFLFSLPLR